MSARREGSWQQFRAAVEEFHIESGEVGENGDNADDLTTSDLPVYQVVRLELQRLGHVEFDKDRNWRVVPPALATIQREGQWVGVVCGARSPKIREDLKALGGWVSCDTLHVPGMPDRLRLLSERFEKLRSAAESIGLFVQENAPVSVLAAVPPVDDPRSRVPAEPPAGPGWMIEGFSTSTLRWCQAKQGDVERVRTGLFRFRMRYQRFHFLRWRSMTFSVPVQVGKYAVMRRRKRRRLLTYDVQRATLSVPAICRPPLLIERALVLCSGLRPRFDQSSGRVEYTDVPWDIARLAAELLRQEVQRR